LATGNVRNIHNVRSKAAAIHVPIPIPIMSKRGNVKLKAPVIGETNGLSGVN
jgi:hypothetical protein